MAEKTIELSFDDYLQIEDKNEKHLTKANKHSCSGIYVVYVAKKTTENKYSIWNPIYIGESEDVYERLTKNHEHYEDWINELEQGDRLCFNIADVDDYYRKRAEAALIHEIKPKINDQGMDSFNYDKTTIKSSGKAKGAIPNEFTVSQP